jgi:hypothetical protein
MEVAASIVTRAWALVEMPPLLAWICVGLLLAPWMVHQLTKFVRASRVLVIELAAFGSTLQRQRRAKRKHRKTWSGR